MFWREFSTKKEVETAIREIVNAQPFGIPFESSLISDLILERHYFCSLRRLRPSRFRKIRGYSSTGYRFEGDFTGLPVPIPISWHPVSWKKCIIEPLSEWDHIIRAMRDRIEPVKNQHRKAHPTCESCNLHSSEEVHHAAPTFHLITESVRECVNDEDILDCLSAWNWFSQESFSLPEGHKITQMFDQHHASVSLQALCHQCHNKTKRRKPNVSHSL